MKYIEFYETKKFPLRNKQYIKGIKYRVKSELDDAYVISDGILMNKNLEGKAYRIGYIEAGDSKHS